MVKNGCPVCSKPYGAGHWSVVDCPQIKSEVVVERIETPELTGPWHDATIPEITRTTPKGTVTLPNSTVTEGVSHGEGIVTVPSPKNRAWEQRNPDRTREAHTVYMRKWRADRRNHD